MYVVDTNVLVVANGQSAQASAACVLASIDALIDVQKQGLALDDMGEILDEYSRYCNYSGTPGLGDQFFLWAFQSQHTTCVRVALEFHPQRSYVQFPDIPALATFDVADRKFVATACATQPKSEIVNAVDSDYRDHADAFVQVPLTIVELCPDCLK